MLCVGDQRAARAIRAPVALALAVALALSACHAWPSRAVSHLGTAGRTVRVVTADGRRRVVLEGATLAADSVIGRLVASDTLVAHGWVEVPSVAGERTAIPASIISRVEVREFDKRRTFAPLAVLAVGAGLAVAIVLLRGVLSLYGV